MRATTLLLVLLIPALRVEDPAPAEKFPASWEGAWKGPCITVRKGKTPLRFPMELHVARREGKPGWTWRIVYGEGAKRQVRPYELVPVEGEPNHFVIDEKNSILIDAYFQDDTLRSRFRVADSSLEVTYARKGDTTLDVTITTFSAKPARTSGGKGNIPAVDSYALRAVQRGALTR